MDVPSYAFLGFVALVAIVINVSAAPAWRRAVLLVANLAFVATFTHDVVTLVPFAALLAFGFAAMKLLERWKSKPAFAVIVAAAVLLFCWLKHYTFVPSALFLPFAYFVVGMSYVFFRIVHLIVDAYQDALPERLGLVTYVNYTLDFTTLVSGPIQFYRDYRRSEVAPLPLDAAALRYAFERIVAGFCKVAIVSPLLFAAHERAVDALPLAATVVARAVDGALVLAIFPVYLYFNFSGYTDVVIGAARLLRRELSENFNRPFAAEGFLEFWNRWHMTLATWVKTYVYSPLLIGLMRRYPSRKVEPWLGVISYFVAFFVVGAWHGQTSMFLFLGVLLGLGVSVNKLYQIEMTRRLGRKGYRALISRPLYSAVSRGSTFAWFAFVSLWFWSSWAQLGRLFSLLGPAGTALSIVLLAAAATVILSVPALVARAGMPAQRAAGVPVTRNVRIAWYAALVVVLLSATVVLNAPAPHVVYKGF